jgi:hypothetical protein
MKIKTEREREREGGREREREGEREREREGERSYLATCANEERATQTHVDLSREGGREVGEIRQQCPPAACTSCFGLAACPPIHIYIYPFFSILLCIPNPSLYIYLTPPFKCIFPIKIGSRGLRGKGRMRNDKDNDVSRMIWREKKGRVSSRSHVFMPSQKNFVQGKSHDH